MCALTSATAMRRAPAAKVCCCWKEPSPLPSSGLRARGDRRGSGQGRAPGGRGRAGGDPPPGPGRVPRDGRVAGAGPGPGRFRTLKLKQDGDKLTGHLVGREGREIKIEEGKAKGGEVSFQITRER